MARLKAAVALIPNVSKEMPPEVNLLDMKLKGPQIAVRPYTHTDHCWQVYFDTNEAIVRVRTEASWPVPSAVQQILMADPKATREVTSGLLGAPRQTGPEQSISAYASANRFVLGEEGGAYDGSDAVLTASSSHR